MGECIILRGGGAFGSSKLTATPDKVRKGKIFLGYGSDNEQVGTLEEVAAESYSLPLNGTYNIPQGIHSGNGKVTQQLPTINGQTIYPTGEQQVFETENKYVSSNFSVAPITNLKAENIKKDVVILGITGTYEGYR